MCAIGMMIMTILEIIGRLNIEAIYWNRCYEPWRINRDTHIKKELESKGIKVNTLNNSFEEFQAEDPQEIVIDEVVGQMLPLLAIPIYETLYSLPTIYYCISVFLLFLFCYI